MSSEDACLPTTTPNPRYNEVLSMPLPTTGAQRSAERMFSRFPFTKERACTSIVSVRMLYFNFQHPPRNYFSNVYFNTRLVIVSQLYGWYLRSVGNLRTSPPWLRNTFGSCSFVRGWRACSPSTLPLWWTMSGRLTSRRTGVCAVKQMGR